MSRSQLSFDNEPAQVEVEGAPVVVKDAANAEVTSGWASNLDPRDPASCASIRTPSLIYTIQFRCFRIPGNHAIPSNKHLIVPARVSFFGLRFNIGLIDEEYKNGLCRMA